MSSSAIMLVEGRKPTVEKLTPALAKQGYQVIEVSTRREALAKLRSTSPLIIVLDMPSVRFSGRRFCHTLDKNEADVPVLMLIDEDAEIDRSDGARAHLRYPFSIRKLANRIERLLPVPENELLRVGHIVLNTKRRSVTVNGREGVLTPKQAQLLEVFMRHPGEILTRAFLMRQVWETDYLGDMRTLEVHVHWLRKVIEEDTHTPVCLQTVRGVGYRFEVSGKLVE